MALLTVVMPVYNAMPHLSAAVESILVQQLRDFEFIIIDDGSTDGSGEYLARLRDTRIRFYPQEHRGMRATRNGLFELSRTKLCALMDADDIALPERLQLQWHFMEEHPDVVLLGGQVDYLIGRRTIAGPQLATDHKDIVDQLITGRAAIRQPACMVRVRDVRAVDGYHLDYAEDHDLFLRLSERGRLANLPERLLIYRMHLGSAFVSHFQHHLMYREYSIDRYRAQQNSQPEPTIEEFINVWNNGTALKRALRTLDAWSAFQYRRALVELGEDRAVRASARLLAAALCRPQDSWRQMTSRLKRSVRQAGEA